MQPPSQCRSLPAVLLIDILPLRRAAIEALLLPWVNEVGALHIEAFGDSADAVRSPQGYSMVVISLGGSSVRHGDFSIHLERIHELAGDCPVIILSDLNDATEVTAAFRAGVRGFLPMSLSPDIAYKTLTFILRGGHFFPSSVLQVREHAP